MRRQLTEEEQFKVGRQIAVELRDQAWAAAARERGHEFYRTARDVGDDEAFVELLDGQKSRWASRWSTRICKRRILPRYCGKPKGRRDLTASRGQDQPVESHPFYRTVQSAAVRTVAAD
jgi:hypothetical protein